MNRHINNFCKEKNSKKILEEKYQKLEEKNTRKILQNMEKANSVIMMINLKGVNTDILKYVAPFFNMVIDKIVTNN